MTEWQRMRTEYYMNGGRQMVCSGTHSEHLGTVNPDKDAHAPQEEVQRGLIMYLPPGSHDISTGTVKTLVSSA